MGQEIKAKTFSRHEIHSPFFVSYCYGCMLAVLEVVVFLFRIQKTSCWMSIISCIQRMNIIDTFQLSLTLSLDIFLYPSLAHHIPLEWYSLCFICVVCLFFFFVQN